MIQRMKYPTAPIHILDAITDYANNHILHGHFVTAVLENNLSEAIFRADPNSLAGLKDIVLFIHWEIPHSSHGSVEKVNAWLEEERTCPMCGDAPGSYAYCLEHGELG
jgi:hypothetical protein